MPLTEKSLIYYFIHQAEDKLASHLLQIFMLSLVCRIIIIQLFEQLGISLEGIFLGHLYNSETRWINFRCNELQRWTM